VFFNEIENPTEPNEQLVNAATQYNEDIKKNEINSTTTNVEKDEVILTDEELKKKSMNPLMKMWKKIST
jgi:predicted double-glycine peptidase